MTVYAFASTRGAPGVTTTALGMALLWPRPVILIEADVSGSSSVVGGYLKAQFSPTRSLLNLAMAHRNGALDVGALRDQTLPLHEMALHQICPPDARLGEEVLLVPALSNAAQASSLSEDFWDALGSVLQAMRRAGYDIIIDTGRLGMANGPLPLLTNADVVSLVTRTQLDPLMSISSREVDHLAGGGVTGLVLVGPGQPYTGHDVSKVTGLPVWAELADDKDHAEVLTRGEMDKKSARQFPRSNLASTLRSAIDRLQEVHRDHRRRLVPMFAEES